MKKIMIEIPDNEIPKNQEIITCDIHFVDGKVCECTYPFEEVNENELEEIKKEIDALYGVYIFNFKDRFLNITDVMQILDGHIKENNNEET